MPTVHLICHGPDKIYSKHIGFLINQYLEQRKNKKTNSFLIDSHTIRTHANAAQSNYFGEIIENFVQKPQDTVIQIETEIYYPFLSYIDCHNVAERLHTFGVSLVIHAQIQADHGFGQSILDLESSLNVSGIGVVVWLNASDAQFTNNVDFKDMGIYKNYRERILGVVVLQNILAHADDRPEIYDQLDLINFL